MIAISHFNPNTRRHIKTAKEDVENVAHSYVKVLKYIKV